MRARSLSCLSMVLLFDFTFRLFAAMEVLLSSNLVWNLLHQPKPQRFDQSIECNWRQAGLAGPEIGKQPRLDPNRIGNFFDRPARKHDRSTNVPKKARLLGCHADLSQMRDVFIFAGKFLFDAGPPVALLFVRQVDYRSNLAISFCLLDLRRLGGFQFHIHSPTS